MKKILLNLLKNAFSLDYTGVRAKVGCPVLEMSAGPPEESRAHFYLKYINYSQETRRNLTVFTILCRMDK